MKDTLKVIKNLKKQITQNCLNIAAAEANDSTVQGQTAGIGRGLTLNIGVGESDRFGSTVD